jgi:hypothetical protein
VPHREQRRMPAGERTHRAIGVFVINPESDHAMNADRQKHIQLHAPRELLQHARLLAHGGVAVAARAVGPEYGALVRVRPVLQRDTADAHGRRHGEPEVHPARSAKTARTAQRLTRPRRSATADSTHRCWLRCVATTARTLRRMPRRLSVVHTTFRETWRRSVRMWVRKQASSSCRASGYATARKESKEDR